MLNRPGTQPAPSLCPLVWAYWRVCGTGQPAAVMRASTTCNWLRSLSSSASHPAHALMRVHRAAHSAASSAHAGVAPPAAPVRGAEAGAEE